MIAMVIKAPQGHTSIYPCKYLKKHWGLFQRYLVASGKTSFNAHVNDVLVKDLHDNVSRVMKMKGIDIKKQIDMHEDTIIIVKEKLNKMTKGEMLDYLEIVTDHRKFVMREATKRGIDL